jgi:hypothetical protein
MTLKKIDIIFMVSKIFLAVKSPASKEIYYLLVKLFSCCFGTLDVTLISLVASL